MWKRGQGEGFYPVIVGDDDDREHLAESYGAVGGVVWDTATFGAVTIRSHPTGLTAESFRTGELRVIHRGK